jgi:lipopolysaccharide transport system ATP-binding protein
VAEIAIETHELTKIYRLYARPHYRLLDMFGLLRRPAAYSEHVAVDRLTMSIARGEKVAIIGRNGAGKSTLLKLITGVIEPTRGSLAVRGRTHALLQIGTGFHPDFTGRQNVYSYLAHHGLTGRQAAAKFAEILDFAELEEYIDQPIKTYSTGMALRLMFSTSTAISPEILVLDEVLGVGDAYFAHKSFERMRAMCAGLGTTLLLVSHDVYSAARLCERMLWIDRGRIVLDDRSQIVIKAYEDSVREQEEQRIRKRKQEALRQARDADTGTAYILVEIAARDNMPQPAAVYFSRIALVAGDKTVAELPLADDAPGIGSSHLQFDAASWGPAGDWQGRLARPLLNYGSSFHKVVGVFAVDKDSLHLLPASGRVEIDYCSPQPCDLVVRCISDDGEARLGPLPPADPAWRRHTLIWPRPQAQSAGASVEVNTAGRQGTGRIVIRDVRACDDQGQESFIFTHQRPLQVFIDYEIRDGQLQERAQVLIVFHRDGVADVCRLLTGDLLFSAARGRCGTIRCRLPRLLLGAGRYTLTVMISRPDYWDKHQHVFYSLNRGVYCVVSRVLEITVEGGPLASGTVFVGEATWSAVEQRASQSIHKGAEERVA